MSRTKFRHEKFRFIQCLCGFSALFKARVTASLSSKGKERRKSALKSPLESSRGGFYFAEYARKHADFVGATLLENLPRAGTGPRSGLDLGQRPSPLSVSASTLVSVRTPVLSRKLGYGIRCIRSFLNAGFALFFDLLLPLLSFLGKVSRG